MVTIPVLDAAARYASGLDLSKTVLIASQHVLETNRTLFAYLLRAGLHPENTHLIGKAYSANNAVARRFDAMGIDTRIVPFDSHEAYAQTFGRATGPFLDDVLERHPDAERYVILEDGGHLLSRMNARPQRARAVGVEQTSSGHHLLAGLDLGFPVVSVARSDAKLLYESPSIAKSALEATKRAVDTDGREVLVIGGGAIGQAIAAEHPGSIVYDISDAGLLEDMLSSHDLIYGCTGKPSVPRELHEYMRAGTVLASVSSHDYEFDAVAMRRQHGRTDDPHKRYVTNGVELLNAGFPVNFTGEENSVPLEDIQLTLGLLYGGVAQATRERVPGLRPLDPQLQRRCLRVWRADHGY